MGDPSSDRKELKANWKKEADVPVLTLSDVKKHKTKQDLWMVIHGGVYNVTDYLRDHPGGPDALMEVAGTDATSAYEDVGHSDDAREIMQPFLVGHLEGASESEEAPEKTPEVKVVRSSPAADLSESSKSTSSGSTLLLGSSVVAAGALAYFLSTNRSMPAPLAKLLRGNQSGGRGGFWHGFTLAAASAAVIGTGSALYLGNMFNLEQDFSSLAAHKQSKDRLPFPNGPKGTLAPSTYIKLALREKTELSNGIYRFVLNLPSQGSVLGLPIGQHIAIRGEVDDHTVTRSYTPISNNRDLGRLELIIRIYPDGKLGNYLKGLQPGDKVDVRGPKGAMRYRKGMSKSIGMVGGGTGITPLFQLVRAICEDKTDDTKISLVYANRAEPDIMLRKRLDTFSKNSNGQFEVYYVLGDPPSGWQYGTGHVDQDILKEKMPAVSDENKVLLCGPPGMVNAMKNNLVELGWKEPGSVSKMSDQIFCF